MTFVTIIRFLILSLACTFNIEVFATKENNLKHTDLKSFMPISASSLNKNAIRKWQNDQKVAMQKGEFNTTSQKYIASGGGYGGNEQTGILIYDGSPNHLTAFKIQRDDTRCFLENQYVGIYHYNFWGSLKLASYECASTNDYHNGVYWNEALDNQNGGYSTDNDALYASMMINKMYEEWFGIPVAQNADGSPATIKIVTHESDAIAYYYDNKIILGNGDKNYYPFTSPGIVSFITAFWFTEQYSNLDINQPESGAISVAFSAMADQALKFYINAKNDWQLGSEVSKTGQPIYYMEQPSKDCDSRMPGDDCSIDNMSQYSSKIDIHYISGIYRRAFYLLSTMPGWDTKKTFNIAVQANRFYWTKNERLYQGVCGLVKAARDFQYDESAVIDAFSQVGLNPKNC